MNFKTKVQTVNLKTSSDSEFHNKSSNNEQLIQRWNDLVY